MTIFGVVLMGVSMFLLTQSTKSSGGFQEYSGLIFLINFIGVLLLSGVILVNGWRLYKQYKQQVPGTRLTVNMLTLLIPLVLIPLGFMFYFSTQFSNDAVDSWFNVEVEQGLQDALNLSRRSLDNTKAVHLARSNEIADVMKNLFGSNLVFEIDSIRARSGATLISVYANNGQLLGTSTAEIDSEKISILTNEMQQAALYSNGYVSFDRESDGKLVIRTAVTVPQVTPIDALRILYAEYNSTEFVSELADNAETVINRYNELTQARKPLKQGFTLALGLAFMISMLAAVWASFTISRRLVQPIQTLAEGTRAVAAGDYKQQLEVYSSDEIGFLTQSFNAMTTRLADADAQMQKSRLLIENERANLAAILSRLSTGVISFDHDLNLRRANHAAEEILGADLDPFYLHHIGKIQNADGLLQGFMQHCQERIENGQTEWREEFALYSTERGRRVLVVACSVLAGEQEEQGIVIVFDDVTRLIRAQRDSAWGEVARRLAHEIKNPLTPIQLSAERLRYRYLESLPDDQKQVLDNATQTIISQVDAMKNMVDAFRDYARAPEINFEEFNLNELLQEIVLLYKPRDQRIAVHVDLPSQDITLEADKDRLRQIMHNLFSNSYDALNTELDNPEQPPQAGKIWLSARSVTNDGHQYVKIELADSGSGFNEETMDDLFEPYVTNKTKGTGLGLAIVRKLIDEHHGEIKLANHYQDKNISGAVVSIMLPANEAARLQRLSKGSHAREQIDSVKVTKKQQNIDTLGRSNNTN
ncbi:MAG: HAMP domain-containing protein [Gammaproteobacteria bacterium]|nr:HAMP domain-containing protein [Gammaproteobacteria bacterium]NNM14707.1 HAMP domain-containing protein [Gammaproteobacteria bacterium]